MGKDYRKWHRLKTKIDQADKSHLFYEREVWWSSVGSNIGSEEDGKNYLYERPILVFKKFNNQMCWAIPMTSKVRTGPYYYSIQLSGHNRTALLSQLRLISTKRFIRKIGKISKNEQLLVQLRVIEIIKRAP